MLRSVWTVSESDSIAQAILACLGAHRNQPFKTCALEVAASNTFDIEVVKNTLKRLITSGEVTRRRRAGVNLASAQPAPQAQTTPQTQLLRRRRRGEKEFYERIRKWMTDRKEWDYGEPIPEKGKKRPKDLRAVPDVAGVKYFAGYLDRIDVHAVEVKAAQPDSHDLSEAFRYSRFADFCYVALGKERIRDREKYKKYKEEARRLGLGIVEYFIESGQRKETKMVLQPTRQDPDALEKSRFLAESLHLYQCQDCGCYFHEDEGKILGRPRSVMILQSRIDEDGLVATATRFRCNKCMT